MYAVAWSQGSLLRRSGCEGRIGESNWRNWRTSLIIGACLLLGGNGGVTISKNISNGIGGTDRRYRSHLHRAVGMVNRNRAATNTGHVDGTYRRFPRRPDFVRARFAFSLHRRAKSGNWDIDPARHEFHLVGRFALFAGRKTRSLAVSHRCATNDLLAELLSLRAPSPANCHDFIRVPFRCCRRLIDLYCVLIGAVVATLRIFGCCVIAIRRRWHTRYVNPIVAVC